MYLVKSFWHASSSCRNRMHGAWKRCGFPRECKHCWTISRTLHTLRAWALLRDRVCRMLQEEYLDDLTLNGTITHMTNRSLRVSHLAVVRAWSFIKFRMCLRIG